MLEASLALMSGTASDVLNAGFEPRRVGNRSLTNQQANDTFLCSDTHTLIDASQTTARGLYHRFEDVPGLWPVSLPLTPYKLTHVPAEATTPPRLGAPAQARVRPGPRTLPAVRGRHEDHRRHRGAGGDRKDPHAPGLCRPALPGAAAGVFSGGLIPEGKNGSAAALTIPHGPRLRAWGQRASK
jgi:hypothetical protein